MTSEVLVECTSPLEISNKIESGKVFFKKVSDEPHDISSDRMKLVGFVNGNKNLPATLHVYYSIDYDGNFHLVGNSNCLLDLPVGYEVTQEAELKISCKGNSKKLLIS